MFHKYYFKILFFHLRMNIVLFNSEMHILRDSKMYFAMLIKLLIMLKKRKLNY